jgi:glycerol-3-phosphate dehydrogenase
MDPGAVRHLVRCYGARADRVLDLIRDDRRLGARVSGESRDLYAEVVYAIREEGARTLSDVVLRRMRIGITASRGLAHVAALGEVAGRELGWNQAETAASVRALEDELLGQSVV